MTNISHERAFELLPWLVNGSLAASERELVESHLRTCLSCHRELKEQQRLRVVVRSQPAVHISPQGGFEKLASTLGGTPGSVRAPRGRGARRLPVFARFTVVAAAGVALVGVLMWLVTGENGDRYAPTFATLATPPAAAEPAIDLIFAQWTTASDMQQLLESIDGSIAAGPSDLGRYTVRFEGDKDGAALDALVEQLQRDSRVRFAGRALAASSTP